MKAHQSASSLALPLLLGLLVSSGKVPTTEATREGITVEAGDTTFSVDRYDDGRNKPYRVTFTEEGHGGKSVHKFNAAGFVTTILVGSERYRVLYDAKGDVSEVRLTPSSSGRRGLFGFDGQEIAAAGGGGRVGEGAGVPGAGMIVGAGEWQGGPVDNDNNTRRRRHSLRRRLYACDDCVEAWDAVCDDGVPSVCDLVGYGHPISAAAEASIATLCDGMGRACSGSGGEEACLGQCEADDDSTDDRGTLFVRLVFYVCYNILDFRSEDILRTGIVCARPSCELPGMK